MTSFIRGEKFAHRKRRVWPKILLTVLLFLFISAAGVGLKAKSWYNEQLRPISAETNEASFKIEPGESIDTIGRHLQESGLIRNARAFALYGRFNDAHDSLQAGNYKLSPSMSVEMIINKLTGGKVATKLFTILPAQRIDQVTKSFIDAGFSKSDVRTGLKSENYADHPLFAGKVLPASLEGYLYPESFQTSKDTKVSDVVKQSLDIMYKKITPDVVAGFKKLNLTIEQGIVLASIVEKEVDNKTDRPTVAQVFIKRFNEGMRLGSDVTAFYGAIIAGQEPSVLYDSPYNTRLREGLPPTPINNVSESSLNAVANPSNTDYLFFVAGDGADQGVTFFAKTFAEHEKNIAAHCKTLCR